LQSKIALYPNPVSQTLNIEYKSYDKIEQIRLFDTFGKLVIEIKELASKVDVSNLPEGLYYLVVQSKGETQTLRIVKNEN